MVTKVATTPTFTAGLPVSWTISVMNTGISDAQGVVVDDLLDPALSGVTVSGAGCTSLPCTIPTLAAGASATVTVDATLASSYPDPTLGNVVDVTSTTTGATLFSASATTPVATATALSVTKSANASPFVPGQAIGWTITVSNAGPSDAQAVTVADVLDPAVSNVGIIGGGCAGLPCVLPTVAAGQTVTLTVLGTLSPSYSAATLSNSVTVSSPTPGSPPASATAVTPVLPQASLIVTKTAGAPSFAAGGPVSWTITIVNPGPSDAHGVDLSDVVDPAVSSVTVTGGGCGALPCTIPTITVGSTVSVTVTGVLAPSYGGATLANTASVVSATAAPPPVTATSVTPVTTAADLAITKVATTPSFAAGRPVGWTVTVTNTGPSDARGVVAVDPIPAPVSGATGTWTGGTCSGTTTLTCALGTVTAGTTVTIDVSGTLSASFIGAAVINSASVTASTPDPAPGNNSVTVSTPVTVAVDLLVAKSASPTPVVPGGPVTWTISVLNQGPGVALATTLTDVVPGAVTVTAVAPAACAESSGTVTCTLGNLAVGQQVDVTIDGTLAAAFPGTTLDNTASATSDSFELTPADNDATSSTAVQPVAALTVTKSLLEDTLPAGGVGTYQVEVANAGPSDAIAVTVSDTVPSPLVVIDASVAGGTCQVAATVTCTIAAIAAGESATVTIAVGVPSYATARSPTRPPPSPATRLRWTR